MSNLTGSTLMDYVPMFGHSQRANKIRILTPSNLKTGFGMSQTRTGNKKVKRKPRRVNTLQKKILAIQPAKHRTVSTNPTVGQNDILVASPTTAVVQGTAIGDRLGDAIHLEALKLNGIFYSATASNAYHFRIMVGYSGEEYSGSTFATGKLSEAELFFTGSAQYVQSIVNPKAFTVLYDEIFDINSQVTDAKSSVSFNQTIPLKKLFSYQSGGGIFGKDKNLYIVVTGVGADVTPSGTTVGQLVLTYDLIFKD